MNAMMDYISSKISGNFTFSSNNRIRIPSLLALLTSEYQAAQTALLDAYPQEERHEESVQYSTSLQATYTALEEVSPTFKKLSAHMAAQDIFPYLPRQKNFIEEVRTSVVNEGVPAVAYNQALPNKPSDPLRSLRPQKKMPSQGYKQLNKDRWKFNI